MPRPPFGIVRDLTPLDSAARALLGYFVYRQYRDFLGVLTLNLQRWVHAGLLGEDGQPTALFKRVGFDFNALDLEALTRVCGVNYVVRASHEKANRVLRRGGTKPRVLYLRGDDYEVATTPAPGSGMGMNTVDTARFTALLGEALGGAVRLFMVMSPNDVAREAGAPALAARLCGDLAPGGVRPAVAGLPFGWQPALEPDALAALHTLHAQRGRGIDPQDPGPIECLPLYLNQLLLRLHTSLLLGAHTAQVRRWRSTAAAWARRWPTMRRSAASTSACRPNRPPTTWPCCATTATPPTDTTHHIGGSLVALPPTAADAPAVREAQDAAERLMRAAWQLAQRTLRGPGVGADLASVDLPATKG